MQWLGLWLLLGCWASAGAEEHPTFRVSGFGTLGLTHSDSSDADYRNSLYQPEGAGHSHAYDLGVESKLGLQLSTEFTPDWSAVVQVQSQRRHDSRFTPEVEWANLKYSWNQNAYVRAGRVVAPMFMASEYRNVGLSLTTVGPMLNVYFFNPITKIDGVDAGYDWHWGDSKWNAQLAWGHAHEVGKTRSGPATLRTQALLSQVVVEQQDWTWRLGYDHFQHLSWRSAFFDRYQEGITRLLANQHPGAQTVEDHGQYQNLTAHIWSAGLHYDHTPWLVQTEIMTRRSPGFTVTDYNSWSLLAAYRWRNFTPYVGYSHIIWLEHSHEFPALAATAQASAQELADLATVNTITASARIPNRQATLTLGVRYDLREDMTLKLQWDHIRKPADSAGLFINPHPEFLRSAKHVNVVSAVLDFVF